MRRLALACLLALLLHQPASAAALIGGQRAVLAAAPQPTLSLDLLAAAGLGACPAPAVCSRTSNATQYNGAGVLVYAPNNLLLNSATLSTQSVTTAAGNYVLSFFGTGSVTASGTATFTLNGTGASNRVSQAFVPTAGALTLTVSGSVTSGQLEQQLAAAGAPTAYNATAGSAYYGPRFDYNPSTLALNGLLTESYAATNLLVQSNGFGGTWTTGSTVTVTSGAASSPDNSLDAWKLAEATTVNGIHQLQQPMTFSAAAYAYSIYAKAVEYSWLDMDMYDGVSDKEAWFNLNTGAAGSTLNGATASSCQAVLNGFWRCTMIATMSAASGNVSVAPQTANGERSHVGVVGSGILIYGTDLKQQPFVDSYVPTTTAQVTRAADSDTVPGAVLPSPTAGALVAKVIIGNPAAGCDAVYLGDSGNNFAEVGTTTGSSATAIVKSNAVSKQSIGATWTAKALGTVGVTWGGGAMAFSSNQSALSAQAAPSPLSFGSGMTLATNCGAAGSPMWFRSIKVWTRYLGNGLNTSANDNLFAPAQEAA